MNKQDILNAFREKFVPSFGLDDNYTYYGGCPDRAVLEQWLLNTLTEFEREIATQTIREVKDSIDEVYFSANPANSTLTEMDRVEIKANNVAVDHVVNILNLLEKEKRT